MPKHPEIHTLTEAACPPLFQHCFPPVVDSAVRLLLLGSLPGEISLAQAQYYANRHNRFWWLLGAAMGEDLPEMAYAERLQCLLQHHVGLWDVVAQAQRKGSLDSNLRDPQVNDLVALVQSLPRLNAIAFNGAVAAKIGLKQLGLLAKGYRIVRLPSSSPAYTLAYAEKLAAWQILEQYCA